MKWLKHETDAMDSEKMKMLIHEFGFEGYGWFWRIMEIIAKKMDETNRCSYEQPLSEWCTNLKVKQRKLRLFLELTTFQTITKVVYSDNKLRIEIPNLLKKRDNYSKNLQVTNNKKIISSALEVEVDVDREVEVEVKKDIYEKPALEVLAFFNFITKRKHPYTACKTHLNPIKARLKDNYTIDQMNDAIKNISAQWLGTNMDQYLVPATVFSKSKIDKNINTVFIAPKESQTRGTKKIKKMIAIAKQSPDMGKIRLIGGANEL